MLGVITLAGLATYLGLGKALAALPGDTNNLSQKADRWMRSWRGEMPKNDLLRTALRESVTESCAIMRRSLVKGAQSQQARQWTAEEEGWRDEFFANFYLLDRKNGAVSRFTELTRDEQGRETHTTFDLDQKELWKLYDGRSSVESPLRKVYNEAFLQWTREELQRAQDVGLARYQSVVEPIEFAQGVEHGFPVVEEVYSGKEELPLTPFDLFVQCFHEKIKHKEGVFEISALFNTSELLKEQDELKGLLTDVEKALHEGVREATGEISQQIQEALDALLRDHQELREILTEKKEQDKQVLLKLSLGEATLSRIEGQLVRKVCPDYVTFDEVEKIAGTTQEAADFTGPELTYDYRWLRYLPRKEDGLLAEFVAESESFLWWALEAEGGMGKSRMALELVLELRATGWEAEFLKPSSLKGWLSEDRGAFREWELLRDTVFVIDYASAHMEEVRGMLDHFSQRASELSLIHI